MKIKKQGLAANQSGLVLIILSLIDYLFDKVFLVFILKMLLSVARMNKKSLGFFYLFC